MIWLYSLSGALLVSLVSLVGLGALLIKQKTLSHITFFLLSLAAGVLLGDAFFHLFPHALEHSHSLQTSAILTVSGILLFFFFEKLIRRYAHTHHQTHSSDDEHFGNASSPIAQMSIIGDTIHNFIDGMIIGASFLISPAVGWGTLIAILAHELPQEFGDIGALVYGGYSIKKAAFINFLCALSVFPGVLLILAFGTFIERSATILLPFSAGSFIYIATGNIMPELNKETSTNKQIIQIIGIVLGLCFMYFIGLLEEVEKVHVH
ncbi:zinc/iron permease [Chloroherpeton thalassium ATCC 35110]|uniref:Zinc/iron permease n=1 Tax=Chloroherpeton thalassium (strain ATCC 35110 / GB-78) TaxID=517418 RepID=B3QX37_CHLT3|nr:ZIP family metal transporter [Chloroherpeton thalassium]ACF14847.1 zinc/iron permease [Chloroherpeton thalassium ATCC 35110]